MAILSIVGGVVFNVIPYIMGCIDGNMFSIFISFIILIYDNFKNILIPPYFGGFFIEGADTTSPPFSAKFSLNEFYQIYMIEYI